MLIDGLTEETCPLCHTGNALPGRISKGTRWLECRSCGLLWEAKQPATKKKNYASYFRSENIDPPTEFNIHDDKIQRCLHGDLRSWHNAYELVERLAAPHLHAHDNCLEVGFGGSEMLDYAKRSNRWKRLLGTEVSGDYYAFAKSKGHEVYYIDISDTDAVKRTLPALQYDLIYSVEVVEHVQDPVSFARGISSLMSAGTVWFSKFYHPENLPELERGEWYYWSRKALDKLFSLAGLRLLNIVEDQSVYYTVARIV